MAYVQKSALVLSLIGCQIFLCYSSVVTTRSGKIIGSTTRTRKGRLVNSFRGIPYAQPPVNELRFQDPEPAKPWRGVLYATQDGSECVQRGNLDLSQPLKVSGNENCLILNVYTPYLPQSSSSSYQSNHCQKGSSKYRKKLPVMFFIHGGGWTTGSSHQALYGPEYLLDTDIVLVTINYRLDVFGFLSTGDELAPGNFGLKDQAMALKWVNENIEYFGGDPAQVTIFGESVGAVSVDSIFYSDLTQGLFQRGISISGTIDMPVAHLPVEKVAGSTKQLAEVVGCPTSPSIQLLKCMQKVPPEDLIKKQTQVAPEGFPPFIVMSWIPVYDYNISAYPYFPYNPRENPSRAKYPWISGTQFFDGSYFVGHFYAYRDFLSRLQKTPQKYLPELLYLSSYLPEKAIPEVTERIVKFYFGSNGVNQTALLNLFSDAFFFIPAVVRAFNHGSPVWYYEDKYILPQSWNNIYGPPGKVKPRPGHTDGLLLLFESSELFNRTDNATDIQVSEKFVQLLTNFAITGNPTSGISDVKWDTVGTEEEFNFLLIDREFVQKQRPYPDVIEFWRSLQREYPTLY